MGVNKIFSKMELKNISKDELAILENYIVLKPEQIVLPEWRLHLDNEDKQTKLDSNIARNGQIINIQVRELEDNKYEIINGRMRFKALSSKNFIIAYNHGKISEEEAMRIALESDIKFEHDTMKIADIIAKISSNYSFEELASTIDYDTDELESLTKLLEFDWDNYPFHGEIEDDSSKDIEIELLFSPEEYERWNNIKSTLDKNDKDTLIYLIDQFYPTIAHNSPIGS